MKNSNIEKLSFLISVVFSILLALPLFFYIIVVGQRSAEDQLLCMQLNVTCDSRIPMFLILGSVFIFVFFGMITNVINDRLYLILRRKKCKVNVNME